MSHLPMGNPTDTNNNSPKNVKPTNAGQSIDSLIQQYANSFLLAPPKESRLSKNVDSSYNSDDSDDDEDDEDEELVKIVHQIVDSPTYETVSSKHEEINRTASDTLAQEYSDWTTTTTTTHSNPPYPNLFLLDASIYKSEPEPCTLSLSSSDSDLSASRHHESTSPSQNLALSVDKLKFATKLGYSQAQAQLVLAKLGPTVSANDFLNELIRLAAKSTPKSAKQPATRTRSLQELPSTSPNTLTLFPNIPKSTSKPESSPNSLSKGKQLRPIVIDGSNVAICHGNQQYFSTRGLRIAIDWFRGRGHREITAFVPSWRKQSGERFEVPTRDRQILLQLEAERHLVFTPSRNLPGSGQLIACYDDRYILNLAVKNGGIVVSNDHFRDLVTESTAYAEVVRDRLLMYTFVGDDFMPPDDPLGRDGPHLDVFLSVPETSESVARSQTSSAPCPYGKKCTFGKKCKYFHSVRLEQAIADQLRPPGPAPVEKVPLSLQHSLPNLPSNSRRPSKKVKKSLKPQQSLPLTLPLPAPELGPLEASTSGQQYFQQQQALQRPTLCRTLSNVPFGSTAPFTSVQPEITGTPNRHRKLERQLTLNPYSLQSNYQN